MTNDEKSVKVTRLKISLTRNLKHSRPERLIVMDNANKLICTVRIKILEDGIIGWWSLIKNFKKALDNSSPTNDFYVYRRYPEKTLKKRRITNILESCIKRGKAELHALRYKPSFEGKVFSEALTKSGLSFKLKKHVYNCLIGFRIKGSRDENLVNTVSKVREPSKIVQKVKVCYFGGCRP